MIYVFKVLSEEDKKFFMEIEIQEDQTFFDLHDLIQEELEYDSSHLATFFIANHNWQRKQEIALIAGKAASNAILMDKAILKDFMKDAHQKILYVFDIKNDRALLLELSGTKSETLNRYYPICTDFAGEIPPQFGKKVARNEDIFGEEEEHDSFSPKKKLPSFEEDFDDDFTPPSFEKDIQFDFNEDGIESGEAEEEEETDAPEDEEMDDEDDDEGVDNEAIDEDEADED
jgi:hypothetical protein